jgi:hypothetical protein
MEGDRGEDHDGLLDNLEAGHELELELGPEECPLFAAASFRRSSHSPPPVLSRHKRECRRPAT